MERSHIHKVLEGLRLEQITDREDWISSQCPFAAWTHEDGVSNRNSFGISVGESSIYHCFSCGKTGALMNLPMVLYHLSGEDSPQFRKYVFDHEHVATFKDEFSDRIGKTAKAIPEKILTKRFKILPFETWRGLSMGDLRFDPQENRIIIPIRDKHGRLVALKGRALDPNNPLKYLLYKEFCDYDPKQYGIWYGVHEPLIPKKFLFLVEGEVDRMTLKKFGITNVWAAMGAGVSRRQIATISTISNPIAYFFDNDKAGNEAKEKIATKTRGLMPQYEVRNYYNQKDAADVCNNGYLVKVINSIEKR